MSFAFGFVATLCLIGVIYLSSQDKPGLTLTAFIAGLALVATLNFRYDIKAIWFIIALVLSKAVPSTKNTCKYVGLSKSIFSKSFPRKYDMAAVAVNNTRAIMNQIAFMS